LQHGIAVSTYKPSRIERRSVCRIDVLEMPGSRLAALSVITIGKFQCQCNFNGTQFSPLQQRIQPVPYRYEQFSPSSFDIFLEISINLTQSLPLNFSQIFSRSAQSGDSKSSSYMEVFHYGLTHTTPTKSRKLQ
jgi:hypothetical protein